LEPLLIAPAKAMNAGLERTKAEDFSEKAGISIHLGKTSYK
jgi:hypothetical protein